MAKQRAASARGTRRAGKKRGPKAVVFKPIPVPQFALDFIQQKRAEVQMHEQSVRRDVSIYLAGIRSQIDVPEGWAFFEAEGVFRPETAEELKAKVDKTQVAQAVMRARVEAAKKAAEAEGDPAQKPN